MELTIVVILLCLTHLSIQMSNPTEEIDDRTKQENKNMQRAYVAKEFGKVLHNDDIPPVMDDLILSAELAKEIADYYSGSRRRKRKVLPASYRWGMPIKYFFRSGFASDGQTKVRAAMDYIESETCARFQQMSSAEIGVLTDSHVEFINSTSCVSFLGRSDNEKPQPFFVDPNCLEKMIQIVHEILQTLGLWHEHQRPDRNDYVTVNIDDVELNEEGSFTIVPNTYIETFGLPYDYASIMHFDGYHLSANGQIILETKNELSQSTIGQRAEISFVDGKLINYGYCNETCSGSLQNPCVNDGYRDPNDCDQCKCPDGFNPPTCQDLAPSIPSSCGEQVYADLTERYITSPGYGDGGYLHNQECSWMIQPRHDGKIQVRFVSGDFGVYCEQEACYHWVEIRHKEDLSKLGYRFCCSTTPTHTFTSVGSKLMVLFRSKYTQTGSFNLAGFKLAYKVVDADVCQYLSCGTNQRCDSEQSQCVCVTGWTGENCLTNIDDCSGSPCGNDGSCVDGLDSYTCNCKDGYTGDTCQEEIQNGDTDCGSCSPEVGETVTACGVVETTRTETAYRTVVYFTAGCRGGRGGRRYRRYRRYNRCRQTRTEAYNRTVTSYEGEGSCCTSNKPDITYTLYTEQCGRPVCAGEGWTDFDPCQRNRRRNGCQKWRTKFQVWRGRLVRSSYEYASCECDSVPQSEPEPHSHESRWWWH